MVNAEALRARCAQELEASPRGYFGGLSWLRDAFASVPREHFVPDRIWWPRPGEDGQYLLIDRSKTPKRWLKAVYLLRTPLITQIDDGAVPPDGPASGAFTSSISCITVVIEMLRHLAPAPGDRVLEIGTGTGYNTALLAHRTGPDTVTTVEIDRAIADQARQRLDAAGVRARVVTADGEQGDPADAPYDRIVCTASVRRIPPAWLRQLRPGGVLVAPLDTPAGHDITVRMTGTGRGGAVGRPVATVEFMRLRGQRAPRLHTDLGWPAGIDAQRWSDYEVHADQHGQRIRPGRCQT
ncbi:methyltransferase domain-containing protein [Streptomyces roseifaciens]|uniref:methyltransferase domain-containing protein n=1 Tax=Streptomyces roseifaciens TaxID=1488406 RepID=UPI000717F35F|nr:methyltransferase domain-containing protein [Streptomyces roseifaciens]